MQLWSSPADQVLAMRRCKSEKHSTIAAVHRSADSVRHKLLSILKPAETLLVHGIGSACSSAFIVLDYTSLQ